MLLYFLYVHIYYLFNASLEGISLERQISLRISFRVYDLRKFKDGSAHGLTEPNDIAHCLHERIGADEYAGYCKVNRTNTAAFPSQNIIR